MTFLAPLFAVVSALCAVTGLVIGFRARASDDKPGMLEALMFFVIAWLAVIAAGVFRWL